VFLGVSATLVSKASKHKDPTKLKRYYRSDVPALETPALAIIDTVKKPPTEESFHQDSYRNGSIRRISSFQTKKEVEDMSGYLNDTPAATSSSSMIVKSPTDGKSITLNVFRLVYFFDR
jgi:hypothetical protein